MASFHPPTHLWNTDTLSIPQLLVEDYSSELHALGRYDDACGESPKGDIGGIGEAATHNHFVHRFATSCARTEFLLLDPRKELQPIADELFGAFTDGTISVLDVPCGTGASILGFLSLIADLRGHSYAKRLPLNVSVTAGDISPHALRLYEAMLQRSLPWLERQSIRLTWQCFEWDVSDESSTARIYDEWIKRNPEYEEWIVLVAAFSGELAGDKSAFDEKSRFFQHILARMHDRFGAMVWVEPQSNESEWLFGHLVERAQAWLSRWFTTSALPNGAVFRWTHPLKERTFNGGLRVLQHRRTGGA